MVGTAAYRFGAAALAALVVAAAGAAQAADGSVFPSNYTFPDGSAGFSLRAVDGSVRPSLLIGFGPVSDLTNTPATLLDLSDPTRPMFNNAFDGQNFFLEWAVQDFGDGSVTPPPAPNSDGITSFRHELGGHVFDSTFAFGPGPVNAASWVAFNPQPDPPGFEFGVDFSYAAQADPWMTFEMREDGQLLHFGLTGTPEPAAWSLMIAGFGLAGAGLRRRRSAAA